MLKSRDRVLSCELKMSDDGHNSQDSNVLTYVIK